MGDFDIQTKENIKEVTTSNTFLYGLKSPQLFQRRSITGEFERSFNLIKKGSSNGIVGDWVNNFE